MGLITKPLPGTPINWLHPDTRGLEACYIFNTGAGSQLWDYANPFKNGNHGTINGATWKDGVLDFDGIDDGVIIPVMPSFVPPLTFSGWVNINIQADKDTIFANGRDSASGWAIRLDNDFGDKINFVKHLVAENQLDIGNFPTGWFHLVVAVNSNNQPSLYVDGVFKDSGANTSAIITPANDAAIGHNFAPGGSKQFFFDGKLDNIYLYNRALSAAEIAWLYYEPYAMFERGFDVTKFFVPVADITPDMWHPKIEQQYPYKREVVNY